MLVRYGDHHLLPPHAVLAFDQFVGEAPRFLVAGEDGAVLARHPPRPRQQRTRVHLRVNAEGPRHPFPHILWGRRSEGKTTSLLGT
jgi:hypothetical protein